MTRVQAGDFNLVPEAALDDGAAPPVTFVPLEEFAATEEDTAEPLLGTEDETVLPADGLLMMYGDGGSGKTTLSIDAVAHLASGESWLGIDVPRPVRIVVVENEGPRAKFRRLLAAKMASRNGRPPFAERATVLEDPWTRFTLRDEQHLAALAVHVAQHEIDVVVMGPLVTLGVIGGGTPEEVGEFEELLRQLRRAAARPFGLWLVHHENKVGDVSGAWERVPDTLLHVSAQGNGHTRLHFQKARWSSEKHGTTMNLVWADGRSFSVDEPRDRDLHAEVLAAYDEHGDEWRTAGEASDLIGARLEPTREVLEQLVERGELAYRLGPDGRRANARCWRVRDPQAGIPGVAVLTAPAVSEHTGAHIVEGVTNSAPKVPEHTGALGAVSDSGCEGMGEITTPALPPLPKGEGREGAVSSPSTPGDPKLVPVPGTVHEPEPDQDDPEVSDLLKRYGEPPEAVEDPAADDPFHGEPPAAANEPFHD